MFWACMAFEEQLREPFGGASHGIEGFWSYAKNWLYP
jgi:hypothetical protein